MRRRTGGREESARGDGGHDGFILLLYRHTFNDEGKIALLAVDLLCVGPASNNDHEENDAAPQVDLDVAPDEPAPPDGLLDIQDILNA